MGLETARCDELLLGAESRPALRRGNAMHDFLRFTVRRRLFAFLRAHRIVVVDAKQHQPRDFLRMANCIERSFHRGALRPAKQMDLLHASERADEIDHPLNVAQVTSACMGALLSGKAAGLSMTGGRVLKPKPSRSNVKVSQPARAKWRINEQFP